MTDEVSLNESTQKSEEEKQDATLHSESTQPDSDGADGTADETSIDYAAIAEEDLRILKEEFPELYGASDITELDDPLRYAALRDLGLSPREAYLATAKPKRRDSRSHLISVGSVRASRGTVMTDAELCAAREIFSDIPDSEIRRLYKRVTK